MNAQEYLTCEDSVDRARSDNHRKGGGAIPASSLYFHIGDSSDAASLVMRFHYSHRMPSNIQFIGAFHLGGGLFGSRGDCVAAVIFSIPGTRWNEPVLELSRLVRKDGIRVPLSKLISLSLAEIRRRQISDLAVSFADSTQKHVGIIYQACGWKYHGKRDAAMDGLVIDGVFVPGRSCNSRFGTRSPSKLRGIIPNSEVEAHYDDGKHLYWKALSNEGNRKAVRLGLKSEQYPKKEPA